MKTTHIINNYLSIVNIFLPRPRVFPETRIPGSILAKIVRTMYTACRGTIMDFPRPVIIISRCIEFENCRNDGGIIRSRTVAMLKEHADCTDICPETGTGLSIPRKPLRLVKTAQGIRLIQCGTSLDMTSRITEWAAETMKETAAPDGIILKSRSASCGNRCVPVYPDPDAELSLPGKAAGMFAGILLERYPDLPVETESRLEIPSVRRNFLTALYAGAALRTMTRHFSLAALQEFHARHKLLLMEWNPGRLHELETIAAGTGRSVEQTLDDYRKMFTHAMKKYPATGADINVLTHVFGFFSRVTGPDEKKHFIDMLDLYKKKLIPAGECRSAIFSLVEKHGIDFLKDQAYFNPYPVEMIPEDKSASV